MSSPSLLLYAAAVAVPSFTIGLAIGYIWGEHYTWRSIEDCLKSFVEAGQ